MPLSTCSSTTGRLPKSHHLSVVCVSIVPGDWIGFVTTGQSDELPLETEAAQSRMELY